MWKALLLCASVGLVAGKATYDNYTVFTLLPYNEYQIEFLCQFERGVDRKAFVFWRSAGVQGERVEVMVAPALKHMFMDLMSSYGIYYEVYIDNVQKLIDKTLPRCSNETSNSFDFIGYHTLDEIYNDLDDLARRYPKQVTIIIGGESYEGRDIKGVKVSYNRGNPGIFVEGGVRPMEWITPAVAMYTLHELLTNNKSYIRHIAENYDWYIFPVFNPDGYVYTHTTDRLWKKSRTPYGSCYGSDMNRNWNYNWGGAKSDSNNSCSDSYAGEFPSSDLETDTMSEYIESIKKKFFAYFSLTTYAKFLIYSREDLTNTDEHDIAKKGAEILGYNYNFWYYVGVINKVYNISGSSTQYIKEKYNKPLVLNYELGDNDANGFLHPPEKIIPIGNATVNSLAAILQEANARGLPWK